MPTCVLVVPANRDASNALELLNVLQSLTCLANVYLLNERFAVFLGEVGDGEHHSHPFRSVLKSTWKLFSGVTRNCCASSGAEVRATTAALAWIGISESCWTAGLSSC